MVSAAMSQRWAGISQDPGDLYLLLLERSSKGGGGKALLRFLTPHPQAPNPPPTRPSPAMDHYQPESWILGLGLWLFGA